MTTQRVRLRPEVESIVPYRQGNAAAAEAFKLSSNENPYDPLPAVLDAVGGAQINRYPDASALAVREKLSTKFGVSPQQVQVGAGSVAVLAQLISAACSVGDEVIYAWRSFEAYPLLVATAGATSVQIANRSDHRHDLAAMAAAITENTRVIIVCSPNNPTSTIVTRAEFAAFMRLVPSTVLVILDEAYSEFVNDVDAVNGARVIHDFPNLVVLRTFSKAYGLAGLRIGYAVGPEYVMDAARAVAIPLSVTEPAQLAAIVSLENEAELLARVSSLIELRDEVWAALREQGWDCPVPHGNFIWLPTAPSTTEAAAVFERHGVVVRALGDGLRVTIAEPASVYKLLSASAEVVARQRNGSLAATLD